MPIVALSSYGNLGGDIEKYRNTIDFIQSLKSLLEDPKKLSSLVSEFEKADVLGEQKRKELEDAQDTIDKKEKWVNEFDAQKTAHEIEINTHYEAIEKSNTQLQKDIIAFANEKSSSRAELIRLQTEAANASAEAKELVEEYKKKLAEISTLRTELDEAKKDLQAAQLEFTTYKTDQLNSLKVYADAHAANVQKFAKEREEFENKKKKLNAAIAE